MTNLHTNDEFAYEKRNLNATSLLSSPCAFCHQKNENIENSSKKTRSFQKLAPKKGVFL
jgi:hypothetical protein